MKNGAGKMARDCFALRVRMLNRVVSAIYDDALAPLDLKASQLNVLVAASLRPRARPAELCKRLRMDESTLSRNVQRMRRRGWLRLAPDSDRRSHWIAATRQGRMLVVRAFAAWSTAQKEIERRLGRDGQAALRMLAGKLL
ncbi:MAG TPA: MarR family winged helix-turn-helix transcriptional regulator [Candidatus Binataceae bacterium]|jgi:DNA-binding MarR family transcriptional regulator|nr:MarR family winged helix-turn-helix transcriptional regulator [Candidatus Binataceae bacterium]